MLFFFIMAKNKETKESPLPKREILDIRKKNLKVVLSRNKNTDKKTRNKSDLIKTLLNEKKKVLKLHQSTVDCLHSEDENSIHEDETLKVLEDEKKIIFSNNDSNNESDNSVPSEVLEANKKWKEEQISKIIFPTIPKNEMNAFLSTLSSDENMSEYKKNLNDCMAHLHTSRTPFWNSPLCITKAIKDSILHRKWNNLTHLLLMLLQLPQRYKPLFRHLCQILNKYHPVIEERGLTNQLNIIYEANKNNHL